MSKTIYIGGRLESKEKGNVVTGANAILDDTKGKKQNVINKETDDELLRLEQSKQDKLNFDNAPTENSNNPVTSGGVYTAEKALSDAIEAILLLIPSAATELNKLVDTNTMNSSISTATATFRGTYNAVSDLGLTYQATHAQIEAALDALGLTADNNDFAFVQIPVSDQSQDIAKTERFKFNGTNWLYEYDLNTSGFTAAQWAAINSGITLALVQKLAALPTNAELLQALGLKQDVLTFDNAPTTDSNNPVKSGGIKNAIDTAVGDEATARENVDTALIGLIGDEKTRAEGVEGGLDTRLGAVEGSVSTIHGVIPSEATSSNKLVDNSSMATYIGTIIDNIDATFNVQSTDGHVILQVTQVDGVITSVQVTTSDIASAADLTLLAGRVTSAEGNITSLTTRMGTAESNITSLGGRMNTAEGNITSLGGRVSTNETDIANLQQLYNNLQQSKPVPVTALPSTGQQQGVIYRLAGTTYYSDYMWNGSTWVLMATYNNAIDDVPTAGSDNLVKSGGVWNSVGAVEDFINGRELTIDQNQVWTVYPIRIKVGEYKLLKILSEGDLQAIRYFDASMNMLYHQASGATKGEIVYLASEYDVYYIALAGSTERVFLYDRNNLNTKVDNIEESEYNINLFDKTKTIDIEEGYAYNTKTYEFVSASGWCTVRIKGFYGGEKLLIKTPTLDSIYGAKIVDALENRVSSISLLNNCIISIPTNSIGYSVILSYKKTDEDNFKVLLRDSDYSRWLIYQKSINKSILIKNKGDVLLYDKTCDYIAWFQGCLFNGKEYHVGTAGRNHAGVEPYGGPIMFEIDANGNRKIQNPFGTLEVLSGRWAFGDAIGLSRDGRYMFVGLINQGQTGQGEYTVNKQPIYVFDKSLNTVATIETTNSNVPQMYGNIIETPEHYLLITAYAAVDGADTLYIYKSNEKITDTWNLSFTLVKTFPQSGVGVNEASMGYVGNKLVLISRVNSAASVLSETSNLEGTDGWSNWYGLDAVLHAPAMLFYNKSNIFPFAASLANGNPGAATRVPAICYYDLENHKVLRVTDISNGEIQGWGGYPSFVKIDDETFAMMYYDDFENNKSTVFYQRVNARYKCGLDYLI